MSKILQMSCLVLLAFPLSISHLGFPEQLARLPATTTVISQTTPAPSLQPVIAKDKKAKRSQKKKNFLPLFKSKVGLEDFESDPEVALEADHILTKNIAAILKSEYASHFGQIVFEDQHFSYFETQTPQHFIRVAFNPRLGTYHPLSSILHLTDIDKSLRLEILKMGSEEYYYHARLKLLSLKSSQSKIIELYQELKNRGLKAQLEVIKPGQEAN